MDIRQVIEHIVSSGIAESRDLAFASTLIKSEKWTTLQENYALKMANKYKLEVVQESEAAVKKNLRAELGENRIYCIGEFSNTDKQIILKIPGRLVGKEGYDLPLNHDSINAIRGMGFSLASSIETWLEEQEKERILTCVEFDERLYPFQVEGVKQIEQWNGRVLLSDEVGLGKTAQVCTYLKRHPELEKVVIVCPSGLRLNWKKECELWGIKAPIKMVQGTKDKLPKSGIIIMSYNVVYHYYCDIESLEIDILICDESQALIHTGSKRTKAVNYLSAGIDKAIMISATPLTSRPKNLYTQLNILNRQMFNSYQRFLDTYCGAKRDPSGNGCTNSEQLHEILSKTMMVRRKREDVFDQIPEKTYQVIPIELDSDFRDEYEFAKKEIVSYVKENYGDAAANRARFGEVMVKMEHLKQIAVKGKMKDSIEYIRTITDSEEPVVVFATHKFVIEQLMEEFENSALKIDGSLTVKQKQANIDKFQTDENIMVMACNIEAGSVGVTLTRSRHVVFLQFPWVPASIIQGVGRIDRIGQKSMSLTIHYVVAENTIDETICNILDKKSRIIGDILDAGDVDEGLLLNELIEQFKNS